MTLRAADDFDFIHERLKVLREETASEQADVVWYWDVGASMWFYRPVTTQALFVFTSVYNITRQPDWYGFSETGPASLVIKHPGLTMREVAKPVGI